MIKLLREKFDLLVGIFNWNKDEQKEVEDYLQNEGQISPLAKPWKEMEAEIAKDIGLVMLEENHRLAPTVFDKTDGSMKLARLLLLREFSRRPKNRNNLETQGLVKLVYPALEKSNIPLIIGNSTDSI